MIKKCLVVLLATCCSLPAIAGSYQLNDYSVTGLGRAYAGAGVVGDDFSAIVFNPAGMGLKGSGAQLGLTMVNIRAEVHEIGNNNEEKMNFWAPIPNIFAQYKLNNNWTVGLGVYAPFGLKTQYNADWFGHDTAILSKLDIIDIAPAISYQVNDQWSIGVSLIARYIYGHMTNTLLSALGGGYSDFELDGWTKTAAFGVIYRPAKDTRIGLSYRLRSTQQVKGDHEIKGNDGSVLTSNPSLVDLFNQTATGRASPALPETVTLSAYQKYDRYGFSGTARWTHWSQSFPEFVMSSESRLFQAVPTLKSGKRSNYNYDNTWTLTAGLDYYKNENWTLRCGTGWDESPAHNNISRTVRIPDNDRWWISAGFSYMQDNWQLDFAYAHMFGRTATALETSDSTATKVKYKHLQSSLIGIQYQYSF